MDALKALELIEQLETKLSLMYAHLEQTFSDNKELSDLFTMLHQEEVNHANMAAMQKRIVRSRPADFGDVDVNFSDFKQVLDYISVVMGMPRTNVNEILVQCYMIESSLVEQYVVAALRGNREIKPLLDSLSQGFRDHLASLAARVTQLGVDLKKTDAIRKLPRVFFSEKVMVNEKVIGKGVDISESGIFVLTAHTFPEQAMVTLSFQISGSVVRAGAIVRYSVPNAGVGLNFTELTEHDRGKIQEYVDQRLAWMLTDHEQGRG